MISIPTFVKWHFVTPSHQWDWKKNLTHKKNEQSVSKCPPPRVNLLHMFRHVLFDSKMKKWLFCTKKKKKNTHGIVRITFDTSESRPPTPSMAKTMKKVRHSPGRRCGWKGKKWTNQFLLFHFFLFFASLLFVEKKRVKKNTHRFIWTQRHFCCCPPPNSGIVRNKMFSLRPVLVFVSSHRPARHKHENSSRKEMLLTWGWKGGGTVQVEKKKK